MSSQQHTPTTEEVRQSYSIPWHEPENHSGAEAAKEFNRWHAAEIAAAEQRGAEPFINMVERVAEHPALIGTQTAQDAKQLLDSIQTDQMEGDDGT